MARIERIEYLVAYSKHPEPLSPAAAALEEREPLDGSTGFDKAEFAINQVKLAEYREFERSRYANPFCYDTERDVFTKLEELRGTTREKDALAMAIACLEDHASDLGLADGGTTLVQGPASNSVNAFSAKSNLLDVPLRKAGTVRQNRWR